MFGYCLLCYCCIVDDSHFLFGDEVHDCFENKLRDNKIHLRSRHLG